MKKVDRLKRITGIKGSIRKWNNIYDKLFMIYDIAQQECALCEYSINAKKPYPNMKICNYCPLGYHYERCGDDSSQFTRFITKLWDAIDEADSFRCHIQDLLTEKEVYEEKSKKTKR